MPNKINKILLLSLIPAVSLLIWHGNITAIEIKDFVVQLICLGIFFVSVLKVVLSDRIRIRKDPLVGFVAAYGALMLVAYALSNQASINTRALIPQIYGIITFILVIHCFSGKDAKGILHLGSGLPWEI